MINVVGMGYIGLPTALMLARSGLKVVGTDIDEKRISILKNKQVTFKEKGLEPLFFEAVSQGITFSTEYKIAEYYIVAVPTPYNKDSKKIDSQLLSTAIMQILEVCPNDAIIIIESTISPGTIDKHVRPLLTEKKCNSHCNVYLAHAPERITPGNMIFELINNSRTIGCDNRVIGEKIKELYATFCQGEIIVTDIRTAEMTKVVENTYRDINIAFANELAKICRLDGMDIYEIIRIANKHPRVNILQPGPGVGGHCIAVDPWFLVGDYPGLANLILSARKINDSMPEFVLERIYNIMREKALSNTEKVGFYGLTYKENVDDTRESPTLQLLERMKKHLAQGAKFYDPYIRNDIVPNQYHDFDKFLEDIDFVVIMVAHDEIKQQLYKLKTKIVLDTKNICNDKEVYQL